jgi:two-component sensor histidine kinase
MLVNEINHRIKNSLQIVASMLHVHSSFSENEQVKRELRQAGSRITAIARAHERLYSGDKIEALDLGNYLQEVCPDIAASLANCEIKVSAEPGIVVNMDRAVSAALVVNELITNAAKYAYADRDCRVWISISCQPDALVLISVRDEGAGLPAQFGLQSGRLGMRIVNAFVDQLRGQMEFFRKDPGTEFVLKFPLRLIG